MDPVTATTMGIVVVYKLLDLAFNAWEMTRQAGGEDAIPEWDEISSKNARLQAKIEAEKAAG